MIKPNLKYKKIYKKKNVKKPDVNMYKNIYSRSWKKIKDKLFLRKSLKNLKKRIFLKNLKKRIFYKNLKKRIFYKNLKKRIFLKNLKKRIFYKNLKERIFRKNFFKKWKDLHFKMYKKHRWWTSKSISELIEQWKGQVQENCILSLNTENYWLQIYKYWTTLSKLKGQLFRDVLRKCSLTLYTLTLSYYVVKWSYKLRLTEKLTKKYLKIINLRRELFSIPRSRSKKKKKNKKFWLHQAYITNIFNRNIFTNAKILFPKGIRVRQKAILIQRKNLDIYKKMRPDFYQTLLGQYFILAHIFIGGLGYFATLMSEIAQDWKLGNYLGWFYINATRMKIMSESKWLSLKKIFPHKLFTVYKSDYILAPWLQYLKSKRSMYSGFLTERIRGYNKNLWVPYLRKKKWYYNKRNQLYWWYYKMLYRNENLKINKMARRKNIWSKIILPFYGNITQKQFRNIKNKIQRKKSESLSREDLLINKFENRLDVVVYRLNLAPNIFWARELIKNGVIFVTAIDKTSFWEKMYASVKKYVYPLKLRDPMNLYKKNLWNPFELCTKIPFLAKPLTNINYLVKPGEIIQCSPNALLNNFKIYSKVWKKPVPKHFLYFATLTESQKTLGNKTNKIRTYSTWKNHTIIATLLFSPSSHTLVKPDRINCQFINWISL